LVRERMPWAAGGGLLGGAHPVVVTGPAPEVLLAARDLSSLVAQLQSVPLPLAVIDPVLNGTEMFIHHEDIRRAQPSWTVRDLSTEDERTLWLGVRMLARVQGRRVGVPLVLETGERRTTAVGGAHPVVVTGPAPEVLLFLAGRSALRGLTYDGPAERVDAVKAAALPL
jgi:uncharacterized protein (TIGR03085 family)